MLTELARPIPTGFWPRLGEGPLPENSPPAIEHASVDGASRFNGPPGTYDLTAHAALMATRAGGADATRAYLPVETLLMMGGIGDRTARIAPNPARASPDSIRFKRGRAGLDCGNPRAHFVDGGAIGAHARTRRHLDDGPRHGHARPRDSSSARSDTP